MTKKETKPLADNLNDIGSKIKGLGTAISVAGAIFLSIGFLVKYITSRKEG